MKRIENKYDIHIGENDKIKHISYWRVGEEFGFDMIIKTHDYNKENRILSDNDDKVESDYDTDSQDEGESSSESSFDRSFESTST